jgi:hypothetical protein
MRILTLLLVLVFAGAVAAPADAQKAARVEKVKKKLRAKRAMLLVDELDLDETTATKLMPVIDRFDDDFARLAKENITLRRDLDAETDDDKLDALIDELVANQRARWDLDEARFKAVRKVLTRQQAAKILIILPEIDRKMLDAVKRVIDQPVKPAKERKAAKRKKARASGKLQDSTVEP